MPFVHTTLPVQGPEHCTPKVNRKRKQSHNSYRTSEARPVDLTYFAVNGSWNPTLKPTLTFTVLQKHIRIFTSAVIYHSDGCITQKFTDMQQYKLRDESRCSGPYCTTIQEDEAQVWKGGVSWEEGHATQVIQLKVYRPWYPEFSASVKEKFYHNVNKWDPLEGASSVLSKHIKPGTTKC